MTKLYRATVYVVDYPEMGEEMIVEEITRSHHISINLGDLDTAEIGEWHDDHPLNEYGCDYESYFSKEDK